MEGLDCLARHSSSSGLRRDERVGSKQERATSRGQSQSKYWLSGLVERPRASQSSKKRIDRVLPVQDGHVPIANSRALRVGLPKPLASTTAATQSAFVACGGVWAISRNRLSNTATN
jgi:hypothetical protein